MKNILIPLYKKTSYIREIVYPRRCPVCEEIVMPKGKKICESCIDEFEYVTEPFCKRCGKPILSNEQEYCFDCTKKRVHFKYGRALLLYNDTARKSVAAYKFQGKKEYADFYAEETVRVLGDYIQYISPDAFVPVPLHKNKRIQRGFNQAQLLAEKIGMMMGIPVRTDLLLRNKNTIPQKDLNDKERLKNLEKAFEVNPQAVSEAKMLKRVLIVDDIYTTGSTIEACAKLLSMNGVEEIYFLCLCIGKGY